MRGALVVRRGAAGFFVALTLAAVPLAAQTAPLWTVENASGGGGLRDLVRGAGQWVGVGDGGWVARRLDGGEWESGQAGSAALRAVVWFGGRFVAVGDGVVVASSDGAAWQTVATVDAMLRGVVVLPGSPDLLVAVGEGGVVLTSADGTAWQTAATVEGVGDLNDVAWTGEQLVAVSSDGWAVTSADGLAWQRWQAAADGSRLARVAAGPGRVVAAGGGFRTLILSSADGSSWVVESEGAGGRDWVSDVAAGGDGFVAGGGFVGGSGSTPWLRGSEDGQAWVADDVSWDGVDDPYGVGDIRVVGWGDGRWLALTAGGVTVGRAGAAGFWRSLSATTYSPGSSLEVSLTSAASATAWTVTERPPAGWEVVDAGSGEVDGSGAVVFTGQGLEVGDTLGYTLRAPAGAFGDHELSGVAELDGVAVPVRGVSLVEDADVVAARALGSAFWLPVAVRGDGAFGSVWRTDLVLRNGGSVALDLGLLFTLPDGRSRARLERIEAGSQLCLEDVLAPFADAGKGPLEIRVNGPLVGYGRISTVNADGSTFGQSLAVEPAAHHLRLDEGWQLAGLRELTDTWRTNLLLVNTEAWEKQVTVDLLDSAGQNLITYDLVLPPSAAVQDLRPFALRADRPDLGWGQAVVRGSLDGVLVSASVVDSRSNDPTTVAASGGGACSRRGSSCYQAATVEQGELDLLDCVASPAGPGHHSDRVTFYAAAGTRVELAASTPFAALLWLETPGGEAVPFSGGGPYDRSLEVTVDEDGTYTVWVTTEAAAAPGDWSPWEITLLCPGPA